MLTIFLNEWRGLLRSRLIFALLSVFAIALVLVTSLGSAQTQQQLEAQQHAKEHIRAQWDEMEPSNPHRAAHFGSYAFKPTTMLSSLDEGVNAVTGNVLRLEGHTQNEAMYSEASQSLSISTFGKLKPSLLFQFVIPLFLIFFAFNTYTIERESGRLKLLLIQGAQMWTVVLAKSACIWTIGLGLLFLTMCTQLLFAPNPLTPDEMLRLGLLSTSYALYYLLLINLTIATSMAFRNSTSALALTIAMWVMWTIFLPKIFGNAVEQIHPLPTRAEFKAEMKADREQGIDGHQPSDQRRKELERATLEKYKVSTLEELPINFAGIVMQADEEYGNRVWDQHFGSLYRQLETQKRYYQRSGAINPFASLQSLSMGAAGTDMFHHLSFLKQTERYRRYFIGTLNAKYAFGGAKTGQRGWKADTAFFQSIKEFTYQPPKLNTLLAKYWFDLFALFGWSIASLLALLVASKKVKA